MSDDPAGPYINDLTQPPVSARYQRVLDCVTEEPLRARDLYRVWAELPEWKSLTTRQRNELRWFAQALENLADDGHIEREFGVGGPGVTFRKREPHGPLSEREVREWLIARGWEPTPISCYDEEGVEGWRWTHPEVSHEFEATGPWDEEPSTSDALREYVQRTRALGGKRG